MKGCLQIARYYSPVKMLTDPDNRALNYRNATVPAKDVFGTASHMSKRLQAIYLTIYFIRLL